MSLKKFIQYPLTLFVVGVVCAGSISLVYTSTHPILEERLNKQIEDNLNKLYDNTKSFETLYDESKLDSDDLVAVYEVKLDDGTTRVVYQTKNEGKNGEILSLLAFNKDKLEKINNFDHMETPGVGAKIDDEKYLESITKQDIKKINVDTISGATYSSTALKKSVEDATEHYLKEVLK